MTTVQARVAATLIVLIVALMLGFSEVDRVVGQIGDAAHHFAFSDVIGPSALRNTGEWLGWSADSPLGTPAPFVVLHLALDAFYIAAYTVFFGILIQRSMIGAPAGSPLEAPALRRRARLIATLALLVVADLVEDAMLWQGWLALQGQDHLAGFATALAWASTAKWVFLALMIVGLVGSPQLRAAGIQFARRAGRGIYVQRLTAVIVVVLAILSLLPLDPILEQVPDIQRGWFDGGRAWHGIWAVIVLVVLYAAFFVIGRKRAELYYLIDEVGVGADNNRRLYEPPPVPWAWPTPMLRRMPGWHYALWIGIPAAIGLTGWIVSLGRPDLVAVGTLLTFLGVFLVLVGGSLIIELVWYLRRRPSVPRSTRRLDGPQTTLDIMRVGDLLAALILVIPAIGLARSLGTPLILVLTHPAASTVDPVLPLADAILWGQCFLIAIFLGLAITFLRVTYWPVSIDPGGSSRVARFLAPSSVSPAIGVLTGALIAASVLLALGFLAAVSFRPVQTGDAIGAVAVTVGSFGAWTLLIALLMMLLRRRRPLALAELVGLRSDPLIALFLLVPFVVSQVAPVAGLHDIDRTAPAAGSTDATTSRTGLDEAFAAWLDRSDDCDVSVGAADEPKIRPLMLVAAEGGGIRAATWTVATMSEVVEAGHCAANSIFLSSGVSGGSIGLAISANPAWNPDDLHDADEQTLLDDAESLRADVLGLANSTALPAAMSGFLVTDQIAGATGIKIADADTDDEWWDRASLIENSWRDSDNDADGSERAGGLDEAYDTVAEAPTGIVVFNSTDDRTACRVVVSQVQLGTGTTGTPSSRSPSDPNSPVVDCTRGIDEPALTVDLLDYLEKCNGPGIDWATAGLISSRFPFVTPSGTVPTDCRMPRVQLIDGGYAENSGLGLLADSADQLAGIVRRYNTFGREAGDPLVVPYVMYIENSPSGYEKPPSAQDTSELFVPFVGFKTGAKQVAASSWMQRIMSSYAALCDPVPALETDVCADDVTALGDALDASERAVLMAATTEPSMTLPLGWGLSNVSFSQMIEAASKQALASCAPVSGQQCLGSYLGLFESTP